VQPLANHPAFRRADGLAQCGPGFGLTKPAFDLIEKGDLMEDPGDEPRGLLLGKYI